MMSRSSPARAEAAAASASAAADGTAKNMIAVYLRLSNISAFSTFFEVEFQIKVWLFVMRMKAAIECECATSFNKVAMIIIHRRGNVADGAAFFVRRLSTQATVSALPE